MKMNHAYLSIESIKEALAKRSITQKEAEKLNKKIDCQMSIYKAITK